MKVMKRFLLVKIILLVSFMILITSGSGCEKRKANSDRVLHYLRGLVDKSKDNVNMRQRGQLAISKWQDGVMDPVLFIIDAVMMTGSDEDGEGTSLVLIIYDEDADYLGFVAEEEIVDSNGVITTKLVEKYPVFNHLSYSSEVEFKFLPVLVRNENQRKPEEQWLKYINTPLQQQKDEYKERTKKNWTWRSTLPPMWISIPDPDKVNIHVRAYDRAGNLSERISLVHEQKGKWPSEK